VVQAGNDGFKKKEELGVASEAPTGVVAPMKEMELKKMAC